MAKRYNSSNKNGAGAFSLATDGASMPSEVISRDVKPASSSNLQGAYPDTFEDVTEQINSDVAKLNSGFKLGKF